jgi:hypothetical protein
VRIVWAYGDFSATLYLFFNPEKRFVNKNNRGTSLIWDTLLVAQLVEALRYK